MFACDFLIGALRVEHRQKLGESGLGILGVLGQVVLERRLAPVVGGWRSRSATAARRRREACGPRAAGDEIADAAPSLVG